MLGAAGKQQLDGLAERLHAERGIELAVVTVDDVPGTPKQFATGAGARTGIRDGGGWRPRAQCPKRNQLRLTNSPPEPVNVITTVCTPVTELVRLVVTLPQVCHPPVLLIGTLAITVPVAL